MAVHWEPLGPEIRILVSPEHKFGTDAFLLSDFAKIKRKDRVVDLCSGCGIVPLLWYRKREDGPKEVVCVEIMEQAADQLQKSIENNHLEGTVSVLKQDLTRLTYTETLPKGGFSLVTCNPPYMAEGRGILSEGNADQVARHETACTLEEICRVASELLQFGGRFCLCHRPERMADLFSSMRQYQIEPKRLRMVQQRPGSAPWLILVEGRKNGNPYLQVEPPLIVEGEQGFSSEILRIYQKEG